jgi:hypothetical protein
LKFLFQNKEDDSFISDVEIRYLTWEFSNLTEIFFFTEEGLLHAVEAGCFDIILSMRK